VDLFFPRAKKRRKARVDVRERCKSLSRGASFLASLFFLRTQNAEFVCFSKATSTHTPREELFRKKKQNRNALPSRRARTKKTRLDDAERRDVPFFARRKRVLSWKETSFARAVFVHAFSMERTFPYRKKIFILAGEKE